MKLFETGFALGICVAAAGCGGIVIEGSADGGNADAATLDSAIATDTLAIDTSTPPPSPGDSSLPSTDAPGPSDEACTACVGTNCATEQMACAASSGCVAVIKCIGACGSDSTCANACLADDSKPGEKLAEDLIQCAYDKCSVECG